MDVSSVAHWETLSGCTPSFYPNRLARRYTRKENSVWWIQLPSGIRTVIDVGFFPIGSWIDASFSMSSFHSPVTSLMITVRFEKCAWTDDTDQALLIILSFLYNHASPSNLSDLPQDFAARLRIWIEQGCRALDRPPCGIGALVGGVVSGADYLKDPADAAIKRWVKSARHAAPNGSLMRTHPIGVLGITLSEEEAWRLAAGVGMTTHADPRCTVACCISVGLIRGMLRGEISTEQDVDAAIERAYSFVHSQADLMNPGAYTDITEWEIKRHLDRKEFDRHVYAQTFDELKLDNQREMGYVYKCLGAAVLTLRLCVRAAQSTPIPSKSLFEELMTDLIMEGGDSDTNGAAAGALLGAFLGYANLPSHWALGLAHREWLMSKILRLTKSIGLLDGEVPKEADEAPDGGKGLMNRDQLEQRDRAMLKLILERKKEHEDKERLERERKKGLMGWFTN